jgi:hypothetical protein
MKIQRRSGPDVIPAVQVVLNCGTVDGEMIGSCFTNSSDPAWSANLSVAALRTYQFIQEQGIPDDTCLTYEAVVRPCTPVNICQDCQSRTWPYTNESQSQCNPVADYPKIFVDGYGSVTGERDMMDEVGDSKSSW